MPVSRHPLSSSGAPSGVQTDNDLGDRLDRSAKLLGPLEGRFAERFYERLFMRAPHFRSMFPADLGPQRARLGATIDFVVAHMRSPEALREVLRDLGRHHVKYGVRREHYPIVVDEIVGAMVDVAPREWTEDDTANWRTALRLVAQVMMSGMSEV